MKTMKPKCEPPIKERSREEEDNIAIPSTEFANTLQAPVGEGLLLDRAVRSQRSSLLETINNSQGKINPMTKFVAPINDISRLGLANG